MVTSWLIEKALRCPDCGTYYEEWDEKKGGHRQAYYAKLQFCMGCKAKEDAYGAVRENNRDNDRATHGLQMDLERNEDAPGLRSVSTGKPIRLRVAGNKKGKFDTTRDS